MTNDNDYIALLDFFVRLVESTKGTQLTAETAWIGDTQPLAAKFVMHGGSILHLSCGSKLQRPHQADISYLDHHSIIVLVRAAHELYLAFNFIYVAPQTLDEKAFRHKVWELGAFLDRQKFPMSQQENIEKQKSEKVIVDELLGAISSSAVFAQIAPQQQKEALKGEWRLGYSWVDLAGFADLDQDQFRATYRYLCSYAHTGHISILQMGQAADLSNTISLTKVWIDSVIGLTAHFIYDYMKVYPSSSVLFKQDPEVEQLAYIYDGLGRKSTEPNGGG